MSPSSQRWKWASLNDLVSIDTKQVLPSASPDADFNYIALENIESGTGRLVNLKPVKGSMILSGKFRFDKSHVLLGKLRPYLNKVVLPVMSGICSTDILPLLPKGMGLSREWLALCLRSQDFIEYSRAKMDGAKMPRLRTPDLKSYEISVPPLDEQRRIVARIEELTRRAEEARKLRQETVSQIEIAIAAALNLVFGENQLRMKNWKLEPIRLVVEKKETWNPHKDNRTQVQYLEISNIDNSTGKIINTRSIEASNPPSRAKRIIRKGDVVFGTTRPYLKNIAIVPENLNKQICSTGLCVLRPRPERVITEWLFNVCRSNTVVDQVIPGQEKHAYPAISDDAILNSLIPVPPLDKQGQIVSWIKKLTSRAVEIHKLQCESDAEQEIFNSVILAKAFRGEL